MNEKPRWIVNPTCIFCDTLTERTFLTYNRGYKFRGWECPNCHFTVIAPEDIQRALHLVKHEM